MPSLGGFTVRADAENSAQAGVRALGRVMVACFQLTFLESLVGL